MGGFAPPKTFRGSGDLRALLESNWRYLTGWLNSLSGKTVPVGVVQAFAGSVTPNGWLLCDGSAVSRSLYEDLFDVVGTTYGVGDGSTTFNLPDLEGRVPVGLDAAQTEFDTLGETGGAKTHTLTEAEMPTHDHAMVQNYIRGGSGTNANVTTGGGSYAYNFADTTGNAGSGNAHNNLQPYIVLRYIIKV